MREIKFRVWDHLEKKMIYDYSIQFYYNAWRAGHTDAGGDLYITTEAEEKSVIMQYTGLKDKNGIEIYEGDILKQVIYQICSECEHPEEERVEYGIVDFKRGCFTIDEYNLRSLAKEMEVVGNIYQNPELLKVKDESNNK